MDIDRDGQTIFVLTEIGRNNLWSAHISPGFYDNGVRFSDDECERIAEEIKAMPARIAGLEAQLKALQKEKDDVADYLETMTARCVEDTAEVGRLTEQLKTAKRDALQKLADGLEIPPTKEGPFIWGHLHIQIMNEIDALDDANTIGEE